MKILIVDDKPENLYLLELILKGSGYITVSAKNGAEALDLARKDIPDLIITDILMPVMDGFTLCRELKKEDKLCNIPLIFYTATYTDPKDEEFALSLGADRFLIKPKEPEEIITIVEEVLKETKQKNIQAIHKSSAPDQIVLKEYSEALIRKLEDKMFQAEQAEKEVRKFNIALLREIEERKQAEELLRKSEKQISLIYDTVGDIIFNLKVEKDGSYIFTSVNQCFLQTTGLRFNQIIGKSVQEIIPEPSLALVIEKYAEAIREKKIVRWEETSEYPNGKLVGAVSIAPVFDNEMNCTNLVGSVHDITERKKIEEALLASENKYRSFFENSMDAILLTSPDGKIYSANEAACSLFGYSEEEFNRLERSDLVDIIDPRLSVLLSERTSTGKAHGELTMIRKEGVCFPAEISSAIFKNQEGLERTCMIVRDISERKHAESALQESHERYKNLTDISPVGIFHTDKNGLTTFVNPRWCQISGLSSDSALGYGWLNAVHPEDREKLKKGWEEATQTQTTSLSDYRFLRPDGTVTWVMGQALPEMNSENQIVGYIGTITDITDRKSFEETIQVKERQYRDMFDYAPIGYHELDAEGRICWINSTELNMLGYSQEEMIGQFVWKFLGDGDISKQRVLEKLKGLRPPAKSEERLYRRKDQTLLPLLIEDKILHDSTGCITGIRTTLQDITERKRAEEEIRKVNRIYAVLSNINQAIVQVKTEEVLYNEACRIAVEIGKFRMAWIGILDSDTNTVNPVASAGFTEDYLKTINIELGDEKLGQGPTGRAIKSATYYLANDVANNPEMIPWRDNALRHGYQSSAAFPIKEFGKVVGAFVLYSGEQFFFNEVEIGLLEEMATDISFALESIETEKKRKEAEEALLESELLFHNLFEASPDAVVLIDPFDTKVDWPIVECNEMACKMNGYTRSELIGKSIDILNVSHGTKKERITYLEKIKKEDVMRAESYHRHKDGHIFPVEISTRLVTVRGIDLILGIDRDVTERRNAEKDLRILAHSIASINECVSITDQLDQIVFANEAFLKTYGYTKEELIGKPISILRPDDVNVKIGNDILMQTISSNWVGEVINKRKDGSLFPIHLSTSVIKDNSGDPIALIGVATDITESKRAREELIIAKEKAERSDRLKTEFLAQMSHEVRTPIHVINGNVGYLNELFGETQDADIKSCFEGISFASERIIRTMDLILNYAEFQSSGYKPCYIEIDLTDEILNPLISEYKQTALKKGLEVHYSNRITDTNMVADDYSIKQIFANLLDNAIKYTRQGEIEILVDKNEVGNIFVQIKDTGIGMSSEFLSKLYEPFVQEEQGYSRSFDGNGLGLALVQKYCEINNAIINVESKKNVGSVFRVTFMKKEEELI